MSRESDTQSGKYRLLIIDDKNVKGCDWCVPKACDHGGIKPSMLTQE